ELQSLAQLVKRQGCHPSTVDEGGAKTSSRGTLGAFMGHSTHWRKRSAPTAGQTLARLGNILLRLVGQDLHRGLHARNSHCTGDRERCGVGHAQIRAPRPGEAQKELLELSLARP